ncbi:MAG TPA: hypothetical protein PK156_16115 [Polyangium sp.]|nr:hypothetical protein [Polyangium sp.]
MAQNEIAEWITNQVEKFNNGVIKLRYITTKKKEQLDEWPLDIRTARAVARQAWNRAGNDATMFNENPSYELVIAVKQDGKVKIKARYGFQVESSAVEDTRAIMGQATVGFMQQVFTHNEVLMRTLVQVVTAGEVTKLRELERLDQRNNSLEQRLDATREEVERSKDKNHERALAKAKQEGEEKRFNEIVTTGRTMLPFLVNSIVKKNLLPTEGSSPLLAALNPIMESLTPEQFTKMHEILTPAQQVGLSELYKMAKGEEEDAKRRRKKN